MVFLRQFKMYYICWVYGLTIGEFLKLYLPARDILPKHSAKLRIAIQILP